MTGSSLPPSRPSFPRVATEHARDTRVYHHHYHYHYHYYHCPPPSRRRVASTVTIGPLLSRPKVSRRFTALPFPPYVLHTRDDSTPSRRIPTALLRPPSLSDSVARLPPPSEISPSRAAHNSTRALFLPPSRSACKWFERARTLIPPQTKRCEAHGESVESFALLRAVPFSAPLCYSTSEPKACSPLSRIAFSLSPLVTPVNTHLRPRCTFARV